MVVMTITWNTEKSLKLSKNPYSEGIHVILLTHIYNFTPEMVSARPQELL